MTSFVAIRMLGMAYINIDHPKKQLELMKRLAEDFEQAGLLGRFCSAQKRVIELEWAQGRSQAAIMLAEETYEKLQGFAFEPALENEIGSLMIRLAYLHAYSGNVVKAHQYLDEMIDGWCQETSWRRWAAKIGKRHRAIIKDTFGAAPFVDEMVR